MTIRGLREQIQTWLSTITELPGVAVLLERDGEDMEESLEAALRTKGLAIIVLSSSGSLTSQSIKGSVASLDRLIPIALIENPKVNLATGGTLVPAEDAVDIVAKKLLGREGPFGALQIAQDSLGRAEEGDGVVSYFFAVTAPWVLRPAH